MPRDDLYISFHVSSHSFMPLSYALHVNPCVFSYVTKCYHKIDVSSYV